MAKRRKKPKAPRSVRLPQKLPRVRIDASIPRQVAGEELRIHAFVDHYRKTFNAEQSALAAGYAPSYARSAGSHMLDDPRVQELLAKHVLDSVAETNIRSGDILRAASEIAYFDPGDCFQQLIDSKTGVVTLKLQDLPMMPVSVRRVIASFKVVKRNLTSGDGFIDTIIEVKFWNKIEALKLLAMYKNLLNQKAEDLMTSRQLEKLPDEELTVSFRDALDKWDRHVAARAKSRLALVAK